MAFPVTLKSPSSHSSTYIQKTSFGSPPPFIIALEKLEAELSTFVNPFIIEDMIGVFEKLKPDSGYVIDTKRGIRHLFSGFPMPKSIYDHIEKIDQSIANFAEQYDIDTVVEACNNFEQKIPNLCKHLEKVKEKRKRKCWPELKTLYKSPGIKKIDNLSMQKIEEMLIKNSGTEKNIETTRKSILALDPTIDDLISQQNKDYDLYSLISDIIDNRPKHKPSIKQLLENKADFFYEKILEIRDTEFNPIAKGLIIEYQNRPNEDKKFTLHNGNFVIITSCFEIQLFKENQKLEKTIKSDKNLIESLVEFTNEDPYISQLYYRQKINKIKSKIIITLSELSQKDFDVFFKDLLKNRLESITESIIQSSDFCKDLEKLNKEYSKNLKEEFSYTTTFKDLVIEANYRRVISNTLEVSGIASTEQTPYFENIKEAINKSRNRLILYFMNLRKETSKRSNNIKGNNCSFFMGNSGAGKSTSIGFLLGAKFKQQEARIKHLEYKEAQNTSKFPKIQHKLSQSGTAFTSGYLVPKRGKTRTKSALVDFSGFEDSREDIYELNTQMSIHESINQAKSIKSIVVVVPAESFKGVHKGRPFLKLVNRIRNIFKFAFTNSRENSNIFVLISHLKGVDEDFQIELKSGAVFRQHRDELNSTQIGQAPDSKNPVQTEVDKNHLEIWNSLLRMSDNGQIDYLNPKMKPLSNRLLKKYLGNKTSIDKSNYTKTIEIPKGLENVFSMQLRISTGIIRQYCVDIPDSIKNCEDKISKNLQESKNLQAKIEEYKRLIKKQRKDIEKIKSFFKNGRIDQKNKVEFILLNKEIEEKHALKIKEKQQQLEELQAQIQLNTEKLKTINELNNNLYNMCDANTKDLNNFLLELDKIAHKNYFDLSHSEVAQLTMTTEQEIKRSNHQNIISKLVTRTTATTARVILCAGLYTVNPFVLFTMPIVGALSPICFGSLGAIHAAAESISIYLDEDKVDVLCLKINNAKKQIRKHNQKIKKLTEKITDLEKQQTDTNQEIKNLQEDKRKRKEGYLSTIEMARKNIESMNHDILTFENNIQILHAKNQEQTQIKQQALNQQKQLGPLLVTEEKMLDRLLNFSKMMTSSKTKSVLIKRCEEFITIYEKHPGLLDECKKNLGLT